MLHILKYTYFLFFILFCTVSSGQESDIRISKENYSLILKEIEESGGEKRGDLLLEKIEELQYSDSETALLLTKPALALSIRKKDNLLKAKSQFWHSTISLQSNVNTNDLELLLAQTETASKIFEKEQKPIWLIRCWELMAIICEFQWQEAPKQQGIKKEDAKNNLGKAFLLLSKQNEDYPDERGQLLSAKATIYYQKDKSESSLNLWQEAEDIFESTNNKIGLARVNLNLALYSKDIKERTSYFEKSIKHYQELQEKNALTRVYSRYSSFLVGQRRYEAGLQYLHKALNLTQEENSCDILYRLGKAHYFNNPEQDSTTYYFLEAIKNSKEGLNLKCLSYVRTFQLYCEKNNNCGEFLGELSTAYSHILQGRETITTKATLEREKYVQELQAESEQSRRKNIYILSGLLLLGLTSVFFFFYQRQNLRKLKSQNEAQEAKIQALSTRMNPHFISNTLNAIDSMIYTNDKAEASKYLVAFAKLSRTVLANSELSSITLSQEMEMLKHYLLLEEMRFEDKLSFNLTVADNINPENIYLPPMMIQPFIENAVLHGIQPKKTRGKITIEFKTNAKGSLTCTVMDDGIGREQAKKIQNQSSIKRKSYSMKIANERIRLLDKMEGAAINIEDLKDENEMSAGTKIEIIIPQNISNNA